MLNTYRIRCTSSHHAFFIRCSIILDLKLICRLKGYSIRNCLVALCILCLDGNHTLVQERVHRVYSIILGQRFVYTPRCSKPALACMHLTCMRVWGTCLVHTRVLCKGVSMSLILHVYARLHACKMKNVSCRVHTTQVS